MKHPLTAAQRLRAWIERSGLQQYEAADLLGMEPTTLSRVLNAVRRPSFEDAGKIEAQTGIQAVAWLHVTVGSSRRDSPPRRRNMRIDGPSTKVLTR